jgi:polysaccharide pyruvyl transferase
MARVFYIGAPLFSPFPEDAAISDLLRATGSNTGNLLIGGAIKRHLKAQLSHGDLSKDWDEIKRNFDCVVIGASNFLGHGFDFDHYARFLETVDLPCVIIGLGAQAPRYGCRIDIPEGTQRMVRAISKRCASIGVRGYFTASILIEMGIKNVRVIGCPSMFWACRPTLSFTQPDAGNGLTIALNGSANVVIHSSDVASARKLEASLARLALEKGCRYILQNEREMMEIATGRGPRYQEETIRVLMRQYGVPHMWPEVFVNAVKEHMTCYSRVETWYEAMKRFHFVIGSRFHGCLIALLAGIPARMFIHDARTREMSELMGLPSLDIADFKTLDVRELYDSFDPTPVQSAYRYLYQNYIDFLDENRVEHVLKN